MEWISVIFHFVAITECRKVCVEARLAVARERPQSAATSRGEPVEVMNHVMALRGDAEAAADPRSPEVFDDCLVQ